MPATADHSLPRAPKIPANPGVPPVSQLDLPTRRASRAQYPLNPVALDLIDRYMRQLDKDDRIDRAWLQAACAAIDPEIGTLSPRQFVGRYVLHVARQHYRASGEIQKIQKTAWTSRRARQVKKAAPARIEDGPRQASAKAVAAPPTDQRTAKGDAGGSFEKVDPAAARTLVGEKLMEFADLFKDTKGLRDTMALIDHYSDEIYRAVV